MKSNTLLIPSLMLCLLGIIDIDYNNISTFDIIEIIVIVATIVSIIFNIFLNRGKN